MPVSADVFEANTRRDRPVADVDFVVDVDRVGLGAAGAILEDVAIRRRRYDRLIVDQRQTTRLLVHRLFQIAITDADFLAGRADIEDPRYPWFDAQRVVGTRVRAEGFLIAGGDGAAAKTVGVIGQHFGLGALVDLANPLERHVFAATTELVVIAHRVVRFVVVLFLRQTAGHVGAGVVVVKVEAEVVLIGRRPVSLEQHVVDVVAVIALAVTVAIHAGIQQRHAHAVVGRAAKERGVDVFPAAVLGGFQGGADFTGGFFRDRAGNEVDHAADVLRPITHGTGTTNHVDAVEVTG